MKRHNKKQLSGFSLIELIFAIVVIGIIASVAVPRLLGINTSAKVSTISSDIKATISSLQSYFIVHKKVDTINNAITLNSSVWEIKDTEAIYKENEKECVKISVDTTNITITIDPTTGEICKELEASGIKNDTIPLQ